MTFRRKAAIGLALALVAAVAAALATSSPRLPVRRHATRPRSVGRFHQGSRIRDAAVRKEAQMQDAGLRMGQQGRHAHRGRQRRRLDPDLRSGRRTASSWRTRSRRQTSGSFFSASTTSTPRRRRTSVPSGTRPIPARSGAPETTSPSRRTATRAAPAHRSTPHSSSESHRSNRSGVASAIGATPCRATRTSLPSTEPALREVGGLPRTRRLEAPQRQTPRAAPSEVTYARLM